MIAIKVDNNLVNQGLNLPQNNSGKSITFLSNSDYTKALCKGSGNNSELMRMMSFEERLGKDNDPMIMGLSPKLSSTPKKPAHATKSKFRELGLISPGKFSEKIEPMKNIEPMLRDTHGNPLSEVEEKSEGEVNKEESISKIEGNISERILMNSQANYKNLTPREKWQKAIRRVIFLGRFNMLNKELKIDTNLFGKSIFHKNSEQQEVKSKENCRLIILPGSKFKLIWSGLVIICLIFTAIYIPVRITFLDNVPFEMIIFEYLIDCFFFFDIFVNLTSAYYDRDHNLIDNLKVVAKNYLTGWFLIDLVACFPFSIFESNENGRQMGYNKLLRLLRLGRLYRILKLFKSVSIFNVLKKNRTYEKFLIALKMNAGIKRLMKTFLSFILVSHFFACIWFYTAKYNDFNPDTWVVRYAVRDADPGTQYMVSFYWVMTLTTIGYGDIIPYTKTERFLSLIYIIVGVAFVSYSISSLSSIMFSSDSKTRKLKEKIVVLDELAMSLKMDPDLYYRIKTIIRNNHETHFYSDMSHDTLLEELPTSLRSQLITLIYQQNNLGTIAFFHGKSPDFLNHILPLLKRITLEKDDVIYRDGDWADEMYFLLKGNVKLISNDDFVFRNYIEGSYFGESELLENSSFRKESIVAGESCELLALKKKDLLNLLDENEDVRLQMEQVMEKREQKKIDSIAQARQHNIKVADSLYISRIFIPYRRKQIGIGTGSIFNKQYTNSIRHSETSIDQYSNRLTTGHLSSRLGIEKLTPANLIPEVDDQSSSSSSMSSISSSNAYSESSISPQNKETTPYVLSSPNLEREDSDEPEFSINSLDEKLNSNQNMNNYEFKPNKCSLDNPSSRSARMRKEEKKRRKYPKGERKLSKGIYEEQITGRFRKLETLKEETETDEMGSSMHGFTHQEGSPWKGSEGGYPFIPGVSQPLRRVSPFQSSHKTPGGSTNESQVFKDPPNAAPYTPTYSSPTGFSCPGIPDDLPSGMRVINRPAASQNTRSGGGSYISYSQTQKEGGLTQNSLGELSQSVVREEMQETDNSDFLLCFLLTPRIILTYINEGLGRNYMFMLSPSKYLAQYSIESFLLRYSDLTTLTPIGIIDLRALSKVSQRGRELEIWAKEEGGSVRYKLELESENDSFTMLAGLEYYMERGKQEYQYIQNKLLHDTSLNTQGSTLGQSSFTGGNTPVSPLSGMSRITSAHATNNIKTPTGEYIINFGIP